MKKIVFTALAATALMASCSSTQKVTPVSKIAGEWTIEKINGTAIDKKAGDKVPFIGFEVNEKRIYGTAGCNNLIGSLNADNGKIDFGVMGTTQMMCPDMTNEQKVLGAMNVVKGYKLDKKGDLILTDEAGKEVIMLTKKK